MNQPPSTNIPTPPGPVNGSPEVNLIAAALAKAQGAIKPAKKDSENPFFKSSYADLASVWDACREALSANGLSVVQTMEPGHEEDPRTFLRTTLLHSSGQWIAGTIPIKPVKDDPQGLGSAITYCRRYALQALVGIAPEEDDGNAASARPNIPPVKPPQTVTSPQGAKTWTMSEPQRKRLFAIAGTGGWVESDIKKYTIAAWGIDSSKNLRREQYDQLCSVMEHSGPATALAELGAEGDVP